MLMKASRRVVTTELIKHIFTVRFENQVFNGFDLCV